LVETSYRPEPLSDHDFQRSIVRVRIVLLPVSATLALAGASAGATANSSSRPAAGDSASLHTIATGGHWSYVIDPLSESCLLRYPRYKQVDAMALVDCAALGRNHDEAATLITWEQPLYDD
jgi:hypothetical protein